MNGKNITNSSKTDWDRLSTMPDEEIDTSEIPELGDEFFARAELRIPEGKVPIMLSIDEDIVEWFKNQKGDLGRNLTNALRSYTESHR